MAQRYKVTFEVKTICDSEKEELDFHLSGMIGKMFEVFPENMKIERILSKEEKIILQGTCIDSQAEDQYCEKCPGGCIECQKKMADATWLGRKRPARKTISAF